jgi:hypothetical protein
MPESFVRLAADGVGKRLRAFQRGLGSAPHVPEVALVPDYDLIGSYAATVYRTPGAAALIQNLMSIWNPAASTRLVMVRRLTVQMDSTALLASVMPLVKATRLSSEPTLGSLRGGAPFDTAFPAPAAAVRGTGTDGFGGEPTFTMGPVMWQQFCRRMHSAISQQRADDNPVLPNLIEGTPVVLRPGQGIGVTVVAPITAANPATNHWVVNCAWDEAGL